MGGDQFVGFVVAGNASRAGRRSASTSCGSSRRCGNRQRGPAFRFALVIGNGGPELGVAAFAGIGADEHWRRLTSTGAGQTMR